jgi:hypothetical protein
MAATAIVYALVFKGAIHLSALTYAAMLVLLASAVSLAVRRE